MHAEDDGRASTWAGQHGHLQAHRCFGHRLPWAPGPQGIDPNVLAAQGGPTSEPSGPEPGAPKMDVLRFMANNPGTRWSRWICGARSARASGARCALHDQRALGAEDREDARERHHCSHRRNRTAARSDSKRDRGAG